MAARQVEIQKQQNPTVTGKCYDAVIRKRKPQSKQGSKVTAKIAATALIVLVQEAL